MKNSSMTADTAARARRLNIARGSGRSQGGFTLVELMVATTIAVFLLGGLFATVQSTRRAYGNQNLLSQLQDNERLAMSLMASDIFQML